MRRRDIIEKLGLTLSFLIAAFATWLMLQPAQSDTLPSIPHIDKLAHFVAFFFIALPAIIVRSRSWIVVVLAASAFGGLIEIIQPFFGRHRDFADFVADVMGVLVAVPVGQWLSKRWQLDKRKGPQRQQ